MGKLDRELAYGADYRVSGSGQAIEALIVGLGVVARFFPAALVTVLSDNYEFTKSITNEDARELLTELWKGNDWFSLIVTTEPISKPWFSDSEEVYPFPMNTLAHHKSLVELHSFDSESVGVVSTNQEVVVAVEQYWSNLEFESHGVTSSG